MYATGPNDNWATFTSNTEDYGANKKARCDGATGIYIRTFFKVIKK
jgi:hypothetical protein